MELHCTTSPDGKKNEESAVSWNIMVTVFWAEKGVILVNFLAKGTTRNSNYYTKTVKCVNACLRQVCPMLHLHDNARPHTGVHITETITNFEQKVLPHPPNSLHLTPLVHHLSVPVTRSL
jgi:hypothetical protein